jgi:hypothetical protein
MMKLSVFFADSVSKEEREKFEILSPQTFAGLPMKGKPIFVTLKNGKKLEVKTVRRTAFRTGASIEVIPIRKRR